MTDEEAMVAGVMARPWVTVNRLAYADWLDEHDRGPEAWLARTELVAAYPRGGLIDVSFSFRGEMAGVFPDAGTEVYGVVGYEWRWDDKRSSLCHVVAAVRAMVVAVDYDVFANGSPYAGISLIAMVDDCLRYDVAYVSTPEQPTGGGVELAARDALEVKRWNPTSRRFDPIPV